MYEMSPTSKRLRPKQPGSDNAADEEDGGGKQAGSDNAAAADEIDQPRGRLPSLNSRIDHNAVAALPSMGYIHTQTSPQSRYDLTGVCSRLCLTYCV